MSELTSSQPGRTRQALRLLPSLFILPRRTFEAVRTQGGSFWLPPMLVLTVTGLLAVVARGFLQARAAAMGEIPLPVDWQWWSTEMQNQYMQAQQATQSPVFIYVVPALGFLLSLWLGWALFGSLLHLVQTLFGGRGSTQSALNMVAWAMLPLALRDLLRILYMVATRSMITSAGLSGFVSAGEGSTLVFLTQLMSLVDLFVLWQLVLLVIGGQVDSGLPPAKSLLSVLILFVLSLLTQAGMGTLASSLGNLMITRPFF